MNNGSLASSDYSLLVGMRRRRFWLATCHVGVTVTNTNIGSLTLFVNNPGQRVPQQKSCYRVCVVISQLPVFFQFNYLLLVKAIANTRFTTATRHWHTTSPPFLSWQLHHHVKYLTIQRQVRCAVHANSAIICLGYRWPDYLPTDNPRHIPHLLFALLLFSI